MGFTLENWIFSLSTLFGLTVIVLVFGSVFWQHLSPTLINILPNTPTGESAEDGIGFVLTVFDMIPYILGFMVVVFILVVSIKREPTEEYRKW